MGEFTSTFHPIAIIISIIFLLFTLGAYILEKRLRDSLRGHMTLCFVANLTLCFILILFGWFDAAERDTAGCILSGYLILYFFLAFFHWLNALAIDIFVSFWRRSCNILIFGIYAQGAPLIICIITFMVDAWGPDNQSERLSYPNMGVYRCFLGAQFTAPPRSYFDHPNFLYFHMYVLNLQIINLLVVCLTAARMCKSRPESDFRTKMKENFYRFAKLFVILGFYWTGDILSSALENDYGFEETCEIRIVADLAGLFSGVLIFSVLILNKPVRTILLNRIRGVRGSAEEEKSLEELENTRMLSTA